MMRTEVKIGIIVGMVVLGGVIIFLLNQDTSGPGTSADVRPLHDQSTPSRLATDSDRPAAMPGRPGEPGARSRLNEGRLSPTTPAEPRPVRPRPTASPEDEPIALRPPPTRDITLPPRLTTPTTEEPVRPVQPPPVLPPVEQPTLSSDARPTSAPADVGLVGAESPATQPALPPTLTPAPRPAVPPPTAADRPTPPPADAGPSAGRTLVRHKLVDGDSLWALAAMYYNDGNLWTRIRDANPGLDPGRLPVGQVIVVPPKDGGAAPPAPARPAPAPAPRRATYVVEHGDSLIKIARNVLGDPNRYLEIFELNRDKLGDPNHLVVGMELRLPAE